MNGNALQMPVLGQAGRSPVVLCVLCGSASKMEWARQSCRAWGGRLARHRRHSHRFRVPEPGMTTASKIPAAGPTATSPPTPLRKRRGENSSSSLLCGNRRLPLPSRNGRGGPAKRGRGRAVAFSSFQSAGTRHESCLERRRLPGERRPHPRPLSTRGEGRTAAVCYCARSPFASPLPAREGWPRAAGTG